jgi:hypothetical protein
MQNSKFVMVFIDRTEAAVPRRIFLVGRPEARAKSIKSDVRTA